MKKLLLLSLIMVFSWSAVAFSQPAIFDTGDNSLTLQCLRVKQNGQISDTCYNVRLVLDGNSFAVAEISGPYAQAFENTDQVLDVGTWAVDVPYLPFGSDAYAAVLTFNLTDSHLYVSSFGLSTIEISHDTGSSTGSCNLGTILNVGACIVFHDADASAAEAACVRFGGVWDPNGSCPANDLVACAMPPENGYTYTYTYDYYYYDAGIVAMADLLKGTPGAPTLDEMLADMCTSDGGHLIH